MNLNYVQIAQAASDGSPAVVKAAGRLIGLGQPERDALARGKVPGWAWLTLGALAGVVAGVRIYKRWPTKVPKMIAGG